MPSVRSNAAAYIGQRILDARREGGWTQDEVAAATGIDSANIRKYDNGRAMPSIHILVRLAKGLDVEPGSLLTGITPDLFPTTEGDRRRRTS
jgi:transcriptional regulator with XRE-family HTH domain